VTTIAGRTGAALAEAAREARAGWSPWHTGAVVLVLLAALVPAAAPSWVHLDSLANDLYLALAATGLWITVSLAGMPSLGQGAFMALGAFTVALLTAKAGWPALPATLIGVVVAAAGGVLAGIGVVRLRPVFIAVTTWILTWTVVLFLLAFRSVSGGAQGLVVPATLSVDAHYELALALSSRRSWPPPRLGAEAWGSSCGPHASCRRQPPRSGLPRLGGGWERS
jgi:ABC-type branched-subunit amino acid transport system permease subunit